MTELLVGTRKGLFGLGATSNGYAVHSVDFLGVPVTAAIVDRRDGRTYAALDHGHFGVKLHRREPDGDFAEVTAPAYPPKPAGVADLDPVRQTDVPWTTQLLWTIEPGHDDRPGELWAGTIPGGLFQSTDHGESWELVRSLWDDPSRAEWFGGGYDHPGIHSICLDQSRPGTVLVGVSCGGVWRSDDRGSSWTPAAGLRAAFVPPERAYDPVIQDPHRLSRCRAQPDVVWCQHHNGVFRSVDGGTTFTEIHEVPPSTFGFTVAAHPTDGDTAWFVPAVSDEVRVAVGGRLVVAKTTDGGKSFTTSGHGLPDRDAFHLVYRHALAVDSSGDRLAMGSTTGSLWISEDGGGSWSHATSGLPPVACVTWIS